MSNLFTILPFAVNNTSLPVLASGDYELLSDYETSSWEHWIFDAGSSSNLIGGLNARQLIAQSAAPTYSASYLSISGNEGKALLTGLEETSGQTDTVCVVFRVSLSTGVVIPFGTIAKSADPAPISGGAPYIANAARDLVLTYRGTSISSLNTGRVVSASTWRFLAVSRNMATGGFIRTLLGGSTVREDAFGAGYVPAKAGRSIALGSAYYNSTPDVTLDFAEAVVFDRALSASELEAVYLRSKARMADRGITVA